MLVYFFFQVTFWQNWIKISADIFTKWSHIYSHAISHTIYAWRICNVQLNTHLNLFHKL